MSGMTELVGVIWRLGLTCFLWTTYLAFLALIGGACNYLTKQIWR